MAAPAAQTIETAAPTDNLARPIDVVVLLDDSGSMATCWPWPRDGLPFAPPCGSPSPNLPSDPDELRYSAARLLIQLADAQDRIAAIRFDSDAAPIGNLGTLQPIGADENRRLLIDSLQPPQNYLTRGYTRMDLGLDAALRILDESRAPERSRYVLLLTDGEPSTQGSQTVQRQEIADQLQRLEEADVLVVPVVLCNPTAGCADDFLSSQFEEGQVRNAATASDLVLVFSELLADMKPDRAIDQERNSEGALQLNTRTGHGAEQLAFVTPRSGLLSVKLDGAPVLPARQFDDPNVDVNLIEQAQLGEGMWTANTIDRSGFTVVQTASYPYLLSPPPSIAGSPGSIRYYPAGSRPLILARGVGPGANEPILYNGQTQMDPFGRDDLRAIVPAEAPDRVQLQLGTDTQPLQMIRTYQLEARADLPRLEIFSPIPGSSALSADGHLLVQSGFGGGSVADLAATVYITDESEDETGGGRLVHQATMTCADRVCSESGFLPEDGRAYKITIVAEGDADEIRFGDWAQSDLTLAPAVYLRGLPGRIDLAQMPADGWPVELSSGTLEEIGELTAVITLRNLTTGDEMTTVSLDFVEDVPEVDARATALKVDGLDTLRPGDYAGEITLTAVSPAGLPMDVNIRPGTELPVTLSVPRPLARIDGQTADFGAIQYSTSPNFRLRQEVRVPVAFAGEPFPLTAQVTENNCADVTVSAGELQRLGNQHLLPLTLASSAPVPPGTCRGKIVLRGPDGDYDVMPADLDWHMTVDAVEWALVGGDLNFGDLQDAGSRGEGTILLRFNGPLPFVVQADALDVQGMTPEGAVLLDGEQLEMPPVEVTWEPNDAGVYAVPITLVARSEIAGDQLRGSYYAGNLGLSIVGLDDVQRAGISFRSPSLVQRYVLPIVLPVYGLPQAFCTVPLTLLMLLVVVARMRGRSLDEDELEEAAAAAVMQTQTADPAQIAAQGAAREFVGATPGVPETVWGTSEWGSPWAGESNGRGDGGSTSAAGRATNEDPWESSW